MNKLAISLIIVAVIGIGGIIFFGDGVSLKQETTVDTDNTPRGAITVYKSPSCGCCVKYIAYLEGEGFDVETETVEDMQIIKERHSIPYDMQSCHTAVMKDYFIEGHMPIEAIEKLLRDMPQIDGIALPGMPSGSPGMPGFKQQPFVIYALVDGMSSKFMTK